MTLIKNLLDKVGETEQASSQKKSTKDEGYKRPIIFIPGITGSELFSIDEKYVDDFERSTGMISKDKEGFAKRIWIPLVNDVGEINQELNINNELYGLQEGDLRNSRIFDRHTGPASANAVLLNALLLKFPDRPIYQFSYDWRKTNTLTCKKLDSFIKSMNHDGKVKVDIVAHSMGGIVSAHYLREHDKRVEKYVSLCTPYEGAPHAYNQMSSGGIFGNYKDIVLEKLFGVEKDVVYAYDGLVELYPTTKILNAYPYQWVKDKKTFEKVVSKKYKNYEDLITQLHDLNAAEDIKPSKVQKEIKNYLGFTRYEEFLRKAKNYRKYKSFLHSVSLLNRPKSMFIVADGTQTQVSGCYMKDENDKIITRELVTKEGDGLVPLYSACMGYKLDEMPKELREKFKVFKGTHPGMLMDLRALDSVCKFLKD